MDRSGGAIGRRRSLYTRLHMRRPRAIFPFRQE